MASNESPPGADADLGFSYSTTKQGDVRIAFEGRVVTHLKGKEATRFLNRVAHADEAAQQLAMAKATGNFKRGNERLAANKHQGQRP